MNPANEAKNASQRILLNSLRRGVRNALGGLEFIRQIKKASKQNMPPPP